MTFEENFARVKKLFDSIDTKKLDNINDNLAMEVNITDDDCGGIFYVAYINGNFSVEPYDYHDHTVRLSVGADNFIKLLDRKIMLDTLIKKGTAKIDKDIEHAHILLELKEKPIKKAAKKATKETTKKVKDAVKKVDKAAKKAKDKIEEIIPEKQDVKKMAAAAEKKMETAAHNASKAVTKTVENAAKAAEKAVNAAKSKSKGKTK